MNGLSNDQVAEIYRRYGHLLLRRCRHLMRDEAAAEDALQEAFVKILMKYGGRCPADTRLAWLYKVVNNCCIDALAHRRDRPASPAELRSEERKVHPKPTETMHVQRALARLPQTERRLAVLAYIDGVSQDQIAAEVGWSRQTVNKKMGGIRARLRRWLGAD